MTTTKTRTSDRDHAEQIAAELRRRHLNARVMNRKTTQYAAVRIVADGTRYTVLIPPTGAVYPLMRNCTYLGVHGRPCRGQATPAEVASLVEASIPG